MSSLQPVSLPARMFLYTIDQIAALLSVQEQTVKTVYLYYEGRSTGVMPRDQLRAVNIAPAGQPPEWRVSERALKNWLKFKGFRFYERGHVI